MLDLGIKKDKLRKLIESSEFNDKHWYFKDNVEDELMAKIYRLYRQAILDGDMPIACVSGFEVSLQHDISNFNLTDLFGIKESLISIMDNLYNVKFPAFDGTKYAISPYLSGDIYSNSLSLSANKKPLLPINNVYICKATEPVRFRVRLTTGKGIRSVREHYNEYKKEAFISLSTNHCLYESVHITGHDKSKIWHIIDSKNVDIDLLKNTVFNYFIGEKEDTISANDIDVYDLFTNLSLVMDSRYGKAFNSFQNSFLSHFKRKPVFSEFCDMYAGKSKEDCVNRISSIKGVSYNAAFNFVDKFLYLYFERSWKVNE